MTSLEAARQGKSAARQLRTMMNAGVVSDRELDRLLTKIEDGFEQIVPSGQVAPALTSTVTPFRSPYSGARARKAPEAAP